MLPIDDLDEISKTTGTILAGGGLCHRLYKQEAHTPIVFGPEFASRTTASEDPDGSKRLNIAHSYVVVVSAGSATMDLKADSNVPTNGTFTMDDQDLINIVSTKTEITSSRTSSLSKDQPSVSSVSSASVASSSNRSSSFRNKKNQCWEGSEAESLQSRASSGKRRPRRLSSAHWKPTPSEQQQHCTHQHAYEWPNFPHFFQLTAALGLCTLLATGAAWDAEWQCVVTHNNQMNSDNDNNDADEHNPSQDNSEDSASSSSQEYFNSKISNVSKEACIHMLQTIVLPSAGVTMVCALAVLAVIWRYNRLFNESSPPWSQVRNVMGVLCVFFGLILVAQCYSTTAIMLQPAHSASHSR